MQQTETLKLNIIEGTDTVDPAPINENMETLETETQAIREEMTSSNTALTASLTALAANLGSAGKNCRIAWGSYVGTGQSGSANAITLTFDFQPILVLVAAQTGSEEMHLTYPCTKGSGYYNTSMVSSWSGKSVSFYDHSSIKFNGQNSTYLYAALGVDE